MQRSRSVWCVPVVALLVGAALSAQAWPRDVGVSEQEFQDSVYTSITGGYLSLPLSYDQIRTLPLTRRVEVTMAAASNAKAYLRSEPFRQRYAKDLADGRLNSAPPRAPRRYADYVKDEQADADQQLGELKKAMAAMPLEARAQTQQLVQDAEKQIQARVRELTAASAEDRAAWERQDRERYDGENAEYNERVSLGQAFPRDPNALVRRRLQEFLTQTADVDFGAKLDAQHKFVKPEYEAKPKIWKSCFRAGRLATEAARLYVQSWLAEMGQAARS